MPRPGLLKVGGEGLRSLVIILWGLSGVAERLRRRGAGDLDLEREADRDLDLETCLLRGGDGDRDLDLERLLDLFWPPCSSESNLRLRGGVSDRLRDRDRERDRDLDPELDMERDLDLEYLLLYPSSLFFLARCLALKNSYRPSFSQPSLSRGRSRDGGV